MIEYGSSDDARLDRADIWKQWYERIHVWLLLVLTAGVVGLGGYGVYAAFRDEPKVDELLPQSTRLPLTPIPTRRDSVIVTVTPTSMPKSTSSSTVLAPSPTGYPARQTYSRSNDHFTVQLPAGWTSYASTDPETVYFGPFGLADNFPVMVEIVPGRRDLSIDVKKYLEPGGSITQTFFTTVSGQRAEQMIFSGSEAYSVVQTTYLDSVYIITLKEQADYDQFNSILNQWRFY